MIYKKKNKFYYFLFHRLSLTVLHCLCACVPSHCALKIILTVLYLSFDIVAVLVIAWSIYIFFEFFTGYFDTLELSGLKIYFLYTL
jgi:hypothetical protein